MEAVKIPLSERDWFKSVMAIMPIVRSGVVVVAMMLSGLATYYIYQQNVNAQQIADIGELKKEQQRIDEGMKANKVIRDQQVDEIKRTMLTKDVFEAKSEAASQRLDRIEKMVEQLLMR